MYGLKINGKDIKEFGLALRSKKRPMLATRSYTSTPIQDRHGESLDINGYNNRPIEISVYFLEKNLEDLRQKAREFAYWLRKECKLIFDDEPDKYYLGWALDGSDLDVLGTIGEATITFTCKPFAYGIEQGFKKLNVGHNRDIGYKGTTEAPTRIIITNKGNKTINGIKITAIEKGE